MLKRFLKILKWFLITLFSVMTLTGALLIIFKDDIKSYAVEEINANLNKKLNVSYIDVSFWSTFPNLTLSFDDVLIHDKFDTLQKIDTALYAEKMMLKLNPIDAFKGNYSVKKIEINTAQIHLKVDEQNRVNYDFLKPSKNQNQENFDFVLEQIDLTNTAFSYSNTITNQQYSAYLNDLSLNGDFTASVFTLHARTSLKIEKIKSDAITLINNKNANCEIDIAIDANNNLFEIKQAEFTVQNLPFTLSGKVSKDSINFNINAKNLALTEVAKNFSMQQLDAVKELNGAGNVSFNLDIKGKNSTNENTFVFADFRINNGSLISNAYKINKIDAEGFYTNANNNGLLNLKKLNFSSAAGNFTSSFKILNFEQPNFIGKANGTVNLLAVHQLFGPLGMQQLSGKIGVNGSFDIRMNSPTHNPKDLGIKKLRGNIELKNITAQLINDMRIFKSINGELVVRNQNAAIKNLSLILNQTDISINGNLEGIANYFKGDGTLITNAEINSKNINVNDFSSNSNSTLASAERAWVLPTKIKGNLLLNAGAIKYGGHTYSNISTRIKLADRALQFSSLKGNNAGATVTGNVMLKEEYPSKLYLAVDLKSQNIQFKPLFKEWNNFDQTMISADNIEGIARVKLKFSAPFDLINGLVKEEIASTINIDIQNGALRNVSTFKEITKSLKAYGGKLVITNKKINAFEQKLLNLKFEEMSNELVIKNGTLYLPEMTIESNALDVTLSGEHNFNNTVDYHFDFRFRELKGKSNQTEFGEVIDDGSGFTVFLRMFGELENPNFAWDKEQKKIEKQKIREEEITNAKQILKQGFSLKKDSTNTDFNLKPKLKEEVILKFDNDTIPEEKQTKKESKILKNLEKWKKENEEENKEEFEIQG